MKRLEWARNHHNEVEDGFEDVIWSDKSSVQLEIHQRFCYQKKGCAPESKLRYVAGFLIRSYDTLLAQGSLQWPTKAVRVAPQWCTINSYAPIRLIKFRPIMFNV